MKFRGLWIVPCALAAADAAHDASNPLQKVIQLMTELQGKVIADGEEEQKAYNDFTAWCGKSAEGGQRAIAEGQALKEELQAKIEKASSDAEDASSQISALTGSIATDEADLKAATLLREKEHKDFQGVDQELTSTIDTLNRAHKLLESQLKQAGVSKASFLQRPARGLELFRATLSEVVNAAGILSEDDRATVAAALQQAGGAGEGDEDDDDGAPEGKVYTSQSSGILDAIQSMQTKADAALVEARKSEQKQKFNFESFAQSLTAKLSVEKADLENTKSDLARANEVKARSTNELTACEKTLREEQSTLEQLQRNCMNRATEFAEEVRTRNAELEALATAKKAIQDSSAGAEQQTYSFVQAGAQRHRSRARLARMAHAADEETKKLRQLARRTGSLALAQLASRISLAFRRGTGDPFQKVRGLIEGMIGKLETEQKSETSQKRFCDQEMRHTKQAQDARSDDVEEMSVHLESMTADVARLQEDLKTLSEDASSLSRSQAEMDRIRKEENTAFLKAEADMKQGLTGVQRALTILRDYYGGGSAALIQEDVAASMAAQSQQKQAQPAGSGAGGGIIGLLEVVEADFAKSLTEAQALESEGAGEYEKTTQQNRVRTAELDATMKHKQQEMAKLRKASAQVASDRAEAQQELDAVNEYWTKLTQQCSQEQETYASRLAKREAEIQALQEALATLEAA